MFDRVIIADDHPMVRDGLSRIMQKLFPGAAIQEVSDFDTLLTAARAGAPPSAMTLDLMFPGFQGETSIRALRQEFKRTSIIIVSMLDNALSIDAVMRSGADGFISKAASPAQVSSALRAICDGEVVVASAGPGAEGGAGDWTVVSALTVRQRDVLRLITKGLSNKEIARELNLSPATVSIHVSSLLRKLDQPSRAAAAAWASGALGISLDA